MPLPPSIAINNTERKPNGTQLAILYMNCMNFVPWVIEKIKNISEV